MTKAYYSCMAIGCLALSLQAVGPTPAAGSPQPGLQVGDVAPLPVIDEWLVGEPVDLAARPSVRVLALWATWCPPCREAVPALSRLQRQAGDSVVVVGLTGTALNEALSKARAFCQEQSPGYRMAWAGAFALDEVYQESTEMRGLPLYVVIDREGRVAWLSHEVGELAAVVRMVDEGSWDLRARGAYSLAALRLNERIRSAAGEYREAAARGDEAAAFELLDFLIDSGPANPHAAAEGEKLRLLLLNAEAHGKALALARQTLRDSAAACNPAVLSRMARLLLNADLSDPDVFIVAGELALEAEAIDEEVSPWVASTIALNRFAAGENEASLQLQTWARDAATDRTTRAHMQTVLETLESRVAQRMADPAGAESRPDSGRREDLR